MENDCVGKPNVNAICIYKNITRPYINSIGLPKNKNVMYLQLAILFENKSTWPDVKDDGADLGEGREELTKEFTQS